MCPTRLFQLPPQTSLFFFLIPACNFHFEVRPTTPNSHAFPHRHLLNEPEEGEEIPLSGRYRRIMAMMTLLWSAANSRTRSCLGNEPQGLFAREAVTCPSRAIAHPYSRWRASRLMVPRGFTVFQRAHRCVSPICSSTYVGFLHFFSFFFFIIRAAIMLKRFNVTYVKARRAVFEKCTVNQRSGF